MLLLRLKEDDSIFSEMYARHMIEIVISGSIPRHRQPLLSKKNYLLTSKQKDLFNFQLISRFRLI